MGGDFSEFWKIRDLTLKTTSIPLRNVTVRPNGVAVYHSIPYPDWKMCFHEKNASELQVEGSKPETVENHNWNLGWNMKGP